MTIIRTPPRSTTMLVASSVEVINLNAFRALGGCPGQCIYTCLRTILRQASYGSLGVAPGPSLGVL